MRFLEIHLAGLTSFAHPFLFPLPFAVVNHKAGVILAAARGELTQLGIRYKHGDIRSNRPIHEPLRSSLAEADDDPAASSSRCSPQTLPAGERSHATTERHAQQSPSMTAGTMNYLDKVPKGYTPPLASSRSGRHSTATPTAGRPRTAGTEMPGKRPLREPFLDGTAATASASGRRDAPRSRSANHAGRTGRNQRYQQQRGDSSRSVAVEDDDDMVGRWDYASSEDHVSATAYSGMFHPAATVSTGATVESAATVYSLGDASRATLASVVSTGDIGDQQVGGPFPSKRGRHLHGIYIPPVFLDCLFAETCPQLLRHPPLKPPGPWSVSHIQTHCYSFLINSIHPSQPPGRHRWRWKPRLREATSAGIVERTGGAACCGTSASAAEPAAGGRSGRDGDGISAR